MTPLEIVARVLASLLELVGPVVLRRQIDEWELAQAASDAAFRAKFPGEEPPP